MGTTGFRTRPAMAASPVSHAETQANAPPFLTRSSARRPSLRNDRKGGEHESPLKKPLWCSRPQPPRADRVEALNAAVRVQQELHFLNKQLQSKRKAARVRGDIQQIISQDLPEPQSLRQSQASALGMFPSTELSLDNFASSIFVNSKLESEVPKVRKSKDAFTELMKRIGSRRPTQPKMATERHQGRNDDGRTTADASLPHIHGVSARLGSHADAVHEPFKESSNNLGSFILFNDLGSPSSNALAHSQPESQGVLEEALNKMECSINNGFKQHDGIRSIKRQLKSLQRHKKLMQKQTQRPQKEVRRRQGVQRS